MAVEHKLESEEVDALTIPKEDVALEGSESTAIVTDVDKKCAEANSIDPLLVDVKDEPCLDAEVPTAPSYFVSSMDVETFSSGENGDTDDESDDGYFDNK